ncbi:flagellar biosynthetic protein FliR [Paracraurococcus ruber]|uniref:Flagellar biosynthetic protein FliR n=1 Tax=Paracraurococcus ruber TaxID=77675 RepID=A0ABS1D5X5_9PROT|nr:flagellar biosynthetic protein FliR [Paracraurococcus ruber]MBK1661745.1 flagellar biosynthetic protein FliR [Paracraurococcus ruber]TDG17936.1 type III secretion protein [Paracraurococcus ruber]
MTGPLPDLVFHAVLVLARVGSALLLLPGLGAAEVPATIRLALALALTALVLPVVQPGLPALPGDPSDLLRLLLIEIAIGVWLGLLARLLELALAQAGQVMALMVGLASPLQGDAVFGAQATALSRLFGLAAAMLVLSTGLYALPLRAMAESYDAFPPGAALPLPAQAGLLAQAVADSLSLALRLAAPLILAGILGQFALGLLARLTPQVPVFILAAPGQILAGLLLLAALLPGLLGGWLAALREGFESLPGLP